MKATSSQIAFTALTYLFTAPLRVTADSSGAITLPDYSTKPLPLASTYYWFSSVEVGVCYNPSARIGSIDGALHCTHQEKYDIDNNTWTLPQTCVALKPLGGPLSSAVRDSCKNAKGTFNVIKPAAGNGDGGQAYDAIQRQGEGAGGGGAGSGSGSGDSDPAPDSNDQEDADKKKGGGFLGGIGSMFGM
ncbi:hypothetical protein PHBOTO_001494 [Pseudozyma hubeiensis]|nr:hypothetical protein PHBOTO_001494 [Pseudozyma hubeiensis]